MWMLRIHGENKGKNGSGSAVIRIDFVQLNPYPGGDKWP